MRTTNVCSRPTYLPRVDRKKEGGGVPYNYNLPIVHILHQTRHKKKKITLVEDVCFSETNTEWSVKSKKGIRFTTHNKNEGTFRRVYI